MSHAEPRKQSRQVCDKQGGINRHIKDAGHERQPRFLKSPEIPKRTSHPRVITAFRWQRTRKLADHISGWKTPDQRRKQQEENAEAVARAMNNVFGAVSSARHHEESRS